MLDEKWMPYNSDRNIGKINRSSRRTWRENKKEKKKQQKRRKREREKKNGKTVLYRINIWCMAGGVVVCLSTISMKSLWRMDKMDIRSIGLDLVLLTPSVLRQTHYSLVNHLTSKPFGVQSFTKGDPIEMCKYINIDGYVVVETWKKKLSKDNLIIYA